MLSTESATGGLIPPPPLGGYDEVFPPFEGHDYSDGCRYASIYNPEDITCGACLAELGYYDD